MIATTEATPATIHVVRVLDLVNRAVANDAGIAAAGAVMKITTTVQKSIYLSPISTVRTALERWLQSSVSSRTARQCAVSGDGETVADGGSPSNASSWSSCASHERPYSARTFVEILSRVSTAFRVTVAFSERVCRGRVRAELDVLRLMREHG